MAEKFEEMVKDKKQYDDFVLKRKCKDADKEGKNIAVWLSGTTEIKWADNKKMEACYKDGIA